MSKHRSTIYYCISIKSIDYNHVAEFIIHGLNKSGFNTFVLSLVKAVKHFFGRRNTIHIISPRILSWVEKNIGIAATIKNLDSFVNIKSGGDNMYNINVSIGAIDFGKLGSRINNPRAKTRDTNSSKLNEVVRIVTPFIGKTIETIPAEAITELFNLLGRDKVFEIAGDYGIELKDIAVHSG